MKKKKINNEFYNSQNFTTEGVADPSSFSNKDIEDLIARQEIFAILEKLKNNEATWNDILDLATKIINNKNMFLNHPDYVSSGLNEKNAKDSYTKTLGQFESIFKETAILFSGEELLNIAKSGNIVELLDTIGHEMTHLNQYLLKEKIEKNSKILKSLNEDAKQIISDFKNDTIKKFTNQNLADMLNIISPYIDEKYSEKLSKLNDEEFKEYTDSVVFSRYLQLKHEEDARLGGLNFAQITLNEWINDPIFCSAEMKDWLEKQSKHLQTIIDREKQNRETYPNYKEFSDQVSKISLAGFESISKEFDSIIKKLGLKMNSVEEMRLADMAEIYTKNLYQTVSDMICEHKNLDWITEALRLSIKNKSATMCQSLCKKIKNDQSISNQDRHNIGNKIFNFLTDNDIEKTQSQFKLPLSTLLNKNQIKTVIKKLADEEKFVFLDAFFNYGVLNNLTLSEKEEVLKFATKIVAPHAKKMISTFKDQKQFLIYDYSALEFTASRIKSMSKSENIKNNEIVNIVEQFDKIDDEVTNSLTGENSQENDEIFEKKYGKSALEEKQKEHEERRDLFREALKKEKASKEKGLTVI